MKGFAVKSHYFCTAERAAIARKLKPGRNVVGTITLNSPVGGINPMAVEMAGRAGARLVWFPTVDAEHEQKHLATSAADPKAKLPFWTKIQLEMKAEGIKAPLLTVLKNGKVSGETHEVLARARSAGTRRSPRSGPSARRRWRSARTSANRAPSTPTRGFRSTRKNSWRRVSANPTSEKW